MVIRTIFKNGGTCEFQTILDSLYEVPVLFSIEELLRKRLTTML